MSDSTRQVRVRRRPKVFVFLALGALLGVVLAAVLAFGSPASAAYPASQVFGFFALLGGASGALLGGLVAIVLDAALARGDRTATAELDHLQSAPDARDAPDERPDEPSAAPER